MSASVSRDEDDCEKRRSNDNIVANQPSLSSSSTLRVVIASLIIFSSIFVVVTVGFPGSIKSSLDSSRIKLDEKVSYYNHMSMPLLSTKPCQIE